MALEENNEEYMQKLSATHFAELKAVHNTYCSISTAKKVKKSMLFSLICPKPKILGNEIESGLIRFLLALIWALLMCPG